VSGGVLTDVILPVAAFQQFVELAGSEDGDGALAQRSFEQVRVARNEIIGAEDARQGYPR